MAAAAGAAAAAAPVCVLVLGMAGSGKTTFVQRLAAHLHGQRCPPYVINLDPAVHNLPFPANIGFQCASVVRVEKEDLWGLHNHLLS